MSLSFGKVEHKLTSDMLIVTETDAKGIITFAGKDFCKIAGYTREELVGKPHNLVRNSFMPKAAFADLWTTVQKGNVWSGIVVNSTKSGDYYWVKATVYPSRNNDGSVKYISVRVKPSDEEVNAVKKLYPTL